MDPYPHLRDLHPIPTLNRDKPAVLLRDPLQLNGHMLVIPQALAPLLFLCDGTRDLETIERILKFHFKVALEPGELAAILRLFDDAFLLRNDRAAAAAERALAVYRAADHRPPASAGGSYPGDPRGLHHLLQDLLEAADVAPADGRALGLLSPHIDFERGGKTYASIWKRAANALLEADLVLLIGTDHYGGEQPITLSRQHYATPFGVLPTDLAVVDALAEAVGREQAFAGELFHKTEHSLELPLVWLHHLIGDREIPIVPVLCGPVDPADGLAGRFAGALRESARGRRLFTVISGDLSHVGPAFGGEPLTGVDFESLQAEDEHLLNLLENGDADGMLAAVLASGNRNNVCGTYPLYIALAAMGATTGEVNGYEQCPADEEGASIVSIGGVLFR